MIRSEKEEKERGGGAREKEGGQSCHFCGPMSLLLTSCSFVFWKPTTTYDPRMPPSSTRRHMSTPDTLFYRRKYGWKEEGPKVVTVTVRIVTKGIQISMETKRRKKQIGKQLKHSLFIQVIIHHLS